MKSLHRLVISFLTIAIVGALGVGTAAADPRSYSPLPPTIDVTPNPSPYSDVRTVTDGTSFFVNFKYSGGPLPIVSLGTSSNVDATRLISYPATYHSNNGKWDASFSDLVPGTKYFFEIDNGSRNHIGVDQTMYRDVHIDIWRVDVITDGDDGGCGDFWVTYVFDDEPRSTGELCLDDGDSWVKYQSGGFGEHTLRDYKEDTVRVDFFMLDNDTLGQVHECGGAATTYCGDLAYGYRGWDVPTAVGTTDKVFSVTGEGVNANAQVKITVSYRR